MSTRNNGTAGRKIVRYGYPSSPLAERAKLGKVGCWHVTSPDGTIRVFPGDTVPNEVFDYADGLPGEYSERESLRRHHLHT
jgi:hypothetical protein